MPLNVDAARSAFANAVRSIFHLPTCWGPTLQELTEGLTKAFYVGDSRAVDGTTTDVIAVVSDVLFGAIWIGADDKLLRRLRGDLPRRPAAVAPPGGSLYTGD